MKVATRVVLVMILVFLGTGTAQIYPTDMFRPPISFRSQALGGTIFDDLDLVYDPIELRFVDGVRIYTNLSNLTSNQERVLNNVSDNEFLFGASWKNRLLIDLWTSFLVRYQKSRSSNPVAINSDLSGFDDLFGEGNLSNVYNALLDTDGDGLYDVRNTIAQEKTNIDEDRMRMFILNNSLLLSDLTVGLQIIHGKDESEGTRGPVPFGRNPGLFGANPGDPSFSLNYDHFLVQQNFFRDFHQREFGDFMGGSEHAFTHLYLALMKPFDFFTDSLEMRLDLGYMKDKEAFEWNNDYGGTIQEFDQDIQGFLDKYSENETYLMQRETDGNGFLVGLSAKKVFQKGAERKNDGFWRVGIGMNRGSFDYKDGSENRFASRDEFFDGLDTLSTDITEMIDERWIISDEGDGTVSQYFASGLVNLPMGDRVSVGMGVRVGVGSMDRDTKYSEDFRSVEDLEIVDDTLTFGDFQRTSTEAQQADRTYEFNYYRFMFPVGIEYKFTNNKKWSLRFGSIFTYDRSEENDRLEITDSRPFVQTTVRGDGTVEEIIDDNINESVSSHRKDAQSNTVFVYGLGFNPTDNLQIDLLGFLGSTNGEQILDTSFFRNLRLSFTIKR